MPNEEQITMNARTKYLRLIKKRHVKAGKLERGRLLAGDAVQQANSGHPGLPLGAADIVTVLWTRFLRHSPADPTWLNRDRFVLSALNTFSD